VAQCHIAGDANVGDGLTERIHRGRYMPSETWLGGRPGPGR